MVKGKLAQCRGKLAAGQVAHGMNAARRNARGLADDAKLLLEAGRFPRAASLAALSIEESGKVSVLRHVAMAPDQKTRQSAWKDYRFHRGKNAMWILPSLVAQGAGDLDSLRVAADASGDHTALLDNVKQIGFYTDCLGDAHWSEPDEVVSVQVARSLVGIADVLARTEETAVEEIELWQHYMRPVYGAPLEVMKSALLNWFEAMREKGLRADEGISAEAFVLGSRRP